MSHKKRSPKAVVTENVAKNVEKKPDTSPYIHKKKEKISIDLKINELPWTEKQKKFIEIALHKNTKMLICKGPSGTAKSILAVYCALQKLNQKKCSEIIYTRVPVEASKFGIGFIKGTVDDKMGPHAEVCADKLRELLPQQQITNLMSDQRVISIPVGFLRGLNLTGVTIFDEAQNADFHTMLLVFSRMAKYSLLIVTGDEQQQDTKDSAFLKVFNAFNNPAAKEMGIETFEFGKEDICRSEILSYVIETFENINNHKGDWKPKEK